MQKLRTIQNRILKIKKEIAGKPKELADDFFKLHGQPILRSELDRHVEIENNSLKSELEQLEIRRKFILDRRDSFIPKIIWNIAVPILSLIIIKYLDDFAKWTLSLFYGK